MRVSVVNNVSTAADMMRFSDASLIGNAGYYDWDYVIVVWKPSLAIEGYLHELKEMCKQCDGYPKIHVIEHHTNSNIGFVPNLRSAMNDGFEYGFHLNEYLLQINTDCYFGKNWLRGLVNHASPERVVNGLVITPMPLEYPTMRGFITDNLGVPEQGKFNDKRFWEIHDQHYKDNIIFADDLNAPGGFRQVHMMPYLHHRDMWKQCGPWDLELNWPNTPHTPETHMAPDMRFAVRMKNAGARFCMTDSCITYHHEKVERTRSRPHGTEHLKEE